MSIGEEALTTAEREIIWACITTCIPALVSQPQTVVTQDQLIDYAAEMANSKVGSVVINNLRDGGAAAELVAIINARIQVVAPGSNPWPHDE